jgi:hypothetical protein
MDQGDELSLWLASAWLRASGDDVQSLVIEDLQEQIEQGKSMADGLDALSHSERQAGDFGMEIAGTLLAPVLIELLKDFWSGYLKKLGESAGGALAEETTKGVKGWFLSILHKKQDDKVLRDLKTKVDQLAAERKLTGKEAARLLEALSGPKLAQELSERK